MCPLVTPDFSEEVKPVEPGNYAARIRDGEVKVSKKGQSMIKWTFELFGKPELVGRLVNTHTMLVGPGVGRLKQLYKAATGEELSEGKAFDTDSLIGKEVTLTLQKGKKEDGTDSDFPDVKLVAPYSGMQ